MKFPGLTVTLLGKSVDGLISLQFEYLLSKYRFIICTCYLPPEESVWADSQGMYNHLLIQFYNLLNVDAVYVCRDFNSCIDSLQDCITDTEKDVPPRVSLDEVINNKVRC